MLTWFTGTSPRGRMVPPKRARPHRDACGDECLRHFRLILGEALARMGAEWARARAGIAIVAFPYGDAVRVSLSARPAWLSSS